MFLIYSILPSSVLYLFPLFNASFSNDSICYITHKINLLRACKPETISSSLLLGIDVSPSVVINISA